MADLEIRDGLDLVDTVSFEVEKTPMAFSRALELIREGREVRRLAWEGHATLHVHQDVYVMMRCETSKVSRPWMVTNTDLLATDWVLV